MAKLVAWEERMSVGVREIDDQHKQLIEMINELHAAMLERKAKTVLSKIISGLTSYTERHFGLEERYFDKFKYPQAPIHKNEHKSFVSRVQDFQKAFAEDRMMLSMDIMNFLKQWLVHHIMVDDQAYKKHFQEKGLK